MKFKTLITGLLSLCACLACMNKKDHAIAEDKTTDRQEENTKTMLSDEYGSDLGPQFSPDGQKIAFYSYLKSDPSVGRIFIMNKDGSQIKELTSRDTVGMHTEPKWSDNGKKIGYTSFRENGAKIMAIDIDGDQPKPLASITEDGYHMFSCWDAKGDGYYFFHWPAGGFTPDAYYANKTEIIKLTEDGISCRPQLTADGTLFVSKIVDLEKNIFDKYQIDHKTRMASKVAEIEGLESSGNYFIKQEENENGTIFILEDITGKDLKRLGQIPNKSVMFSSMDPLQKYVVYNTSFEDGAEIFLLEIGTGEIIKLTSN